MSKSQKIAVAVGVALVALLLFAATIAGRFIDGNAFKPRLEATASKALGMQLRVEGAVRVSLFPGISITLEKVSIQNRGMALVTAGQAKIQIEFVSLLKNKPRVQHMALQQVLLTLERDRQGVFNFENTDKPPGTPRTLNLTRLSADDAAIVYVDNHAGNKLEAEGCSLNASRLRLSGVSGVDLMRHIDVHANLACARVVSEKVPATDLRISVQGAEGRYRLQPISMQVFGGTGTAEVQADFSEAVPHWQAQYRLQQFRVEQLLETAQPKYALKGLLDFSASLSASGKSWKALQATANGQASLHGENLSLIGRDLDAELARYDSTRNFNLIDAGALFFAGPVGIAVTKGYDFANLFRGKGGTTSIRKLVSQWRVKHGVAEAEDVAIATSENYLALQGGLDFVNERFEHVTVALVDTRGCTRIRQKIRGPFRKPVVEKPNIIAAVTAPVRKLLLKTKEVFTGKHCELFYKGALLAPPQPEGAPSG